MGVPAPSGSGPAPRLRPARSTGNLVDISAPSSFVEASAGGPRGCAPPPRPSYARRPVPAEGKYVSYKLKQRAVKEAAAASQKTHPRDTGSSSGFGSASTNSSSHTDSDSSSPGSGGHSPPSQTGTSGTVVTRAVISITGGDVDTTSMAEPSLSSSGFSDCYPASSEFNKKSGKNGFQTA